MTIKFMPLAREDDNYSNVFDLYEEAFSKVQRVPPWILRYKMRKGKAGFNVIYEQDTWIGFIYNIEYKGLVFIQFFAISEACRSQGYGSKVLDSMRERHSGTRIILNIEKIDDQSKNYPQTVKRKAFYEKNGFRSSGYIVNEPGEQLEMLILGGSISKKEIEEMYKYLLGTIFGLLFGPKIIKI